MAMKGFLGAAAKKNTDIRGFLRDAAGGNSLKYSSERATKHLLYIPFINETVNNDGVDTEVKSIVSISAAVHEWNGIDGKYRSTVCIKDVIRDDGNGNVLNDGTCPFCNRVNDAWEIHNIRKEREEATCGKTGAELEEHMKNFVSSIADERKAKAARDYIYILVAKFRQDKAGAIVINDQSKLPEYDLKVMKLSTNRSEKIQKAVENSGIEMAGAEILFDYPDTEDVRHLSTDCVTVPVVRGTANSIISKFPALEEKILEDAKKFDWEGIEKAFPEWKGMTTSEAETIVKGLFKKYDEYKLALETNPDAKYMEYLTSSNTANPSLGAGNTATTADAAQAALPNNSPKIEVPAIDPNEAFGGIGTL